MFEPAPRPAAVISAIPKGDRPEWIVQKLTEIGVDLDRVHGLRAQCGALGRRSGRRQIERMRRVAREAAMQSRRLWLPSSARRDVLR